MGQVLGKRLKTLLRFSFVGDVRGVGLFQGVEIVKDKTSREHDGKTAKLIKALARREKVLVSTDGVADNILKIKPPIVFSLQDADRLCRVLEQAMARVAEQRGVSASL